MLLKQKINATKVLVAGLTTAISVGQYQSDKKVPLVSSKNSSADHSRVWTNSHTSEGTLVTLPCNLQEDWTPQLAKQFKALAVKRALGTATAEDNLDFEKLQVMRRGLENPLTSAQILAEMKRKQMLDDLERFFDKHAVRAAS